MQKSQIWLFGPFKGRSSSCKVPSLCLLQKLKGKNPYFNFKKGMSKLQNAVLTKISTLSHRTCTSLFQTKFMNFGLICAKNALFLKFRDKKS